MRGEREKRLRELAEAYEGLFPVFPGDFAELVTEAARIGAEIEREECAAESDKRRTDIGPDYDDAARHIARAIRARGTK